MQSLGFFNIKKNSNGTILTCKTHGVSYTSSSKAILSIAWFIIEGLSAFTLPIIAIFAKYSLPNNMFTEFPIGMLLLSIVLFWGFALYFFMVPFLLLLSETQLLLTDDKIIIERKNGPFKKVIVNMFRNEIKHIELIVSGKSKNGKFYNLYLHDKSGGKKEVLKDHSYNDLNNVTLFIEGQI